METTTRRWNQRHTAVAILLVITLATIGGVGAIRTYSPKIKSPLIGKYALLRNPWSSQYQVAFTNESDVQGFLDAEKRATDHGQGTLRPDDGYNMADMHRRKLATYFPFDCEVVILDANGEHALVRSKNQARDYLEGWVPLDWLNFPQRIN